MWSDIERKGDLLVTRPDGKVAEPARELAAPPSSNETAIRVSGLSKCYTIYDRPQDRLKQSIFPRLQKLLGRRAPTFYREFWALRDVSFEVRRGETVGVIGGNGAGKSTLLQLLCGTVHPTAGTVEVRGRVAALLELGSGFNPEFSGRENVCLYATVLGLSQEEIEARLPSILDFAQIGDFVDMPIKTYSTGMLVRLAFATIAHVDADILVIDEALAVGDVFFVQKCMRFLRKFMETGTVLFVSHDSGTVNNLCQRAIWLKNGMIKEIGAPKTVTDAYLADVFEARQGPSSSKPAADASRTGSTEPQRRDQRLSYLNQSKFRNDIELFHFDPAGPSFGRGGAVVVDVHIEDPNGTPLHWCVGGEDVVLCVRCEARSDISRPIVGFIVKDRLGQALFGDNTYLTCVDDSRGVHAGETLEALFRFQMPLLPTGDYSICAAIAEGTPSDHVHHHWVHDAAVFRAHSSSVRTGLMGIPMQDIEVRRI